MSKTLTTILVVLGILVLAGAIFFFGTMYGHMFAFGRASANAPLYGSNPMMGGVGMGMYRNGWNSGNGYGPGMMRGYGEQYGRGSGPGMMGGPGYENAPALTIDQAKSAAQKYLAALGNSDLAIAEVMIFSNNAYVAVKETSTGKGAFELLVDSTSVLAYPEHGPNMMWNLKYGSLNHEHMMGGYGNGMMGNYGWNGAAPSGSPAEMTVTPEQAVQYAEKYIAANIAGASAATDPLQFYGYYTLDFSRDGKVAGMLSVNGFTGQVFVHTWHGSFVEEAQ